MRFNSYIRARAGALGAVALLCLLGISPAGASAAEVPHLPVIVQVTNQFGYPAQWFEFKQGNVLITEADGDGQATSYADVGETVTYTATGGWLPDYRGAVNTECSDAALARWKPARVSITVSADESLNHASLQLPAMTRELTSPGVDSAERRMLALINAERASHGLAPLLLFARASAASDAHATALATVEGLTGHYGPACAEFPAIYSELGGQLQDAEDWVGQVIADYESCVSDYPVERAFASLKDSPQHRYIMNDPRAQAAGIAHVDGEWVVDLIGKNGLKSTDYTSEQTRYALPELKRTSPNKWCGADEGDSGDNGDENDQNHGGGNQQQPRKLTVKKPKRALRRGQRFTLRGRASAGITVRVRHAGHSYRTRANSRGYWHLKLRPRKTARVTVSDGSTRLRFKLRVRRH